MAMAANQEMDMRDQATKDGISGSKKNFGIRSRVFAAGLLSAALVVGCGGWAAQAKLSGAIIAQGQVTVKKQLKLVQHRDGGIVAEIRVANGDKVQAGDVLIRLDETQTRAEMRVIEAQLAEYNGRRARLAAERDDEEMITFETGFESAAATAEIATGERRLFESNRVMRDARREQLAMQVLQYEEEARGLQAQLDSKMVEKEMIADELRRLRPLEKDRLIEGNKLRELERDLVRAQGVMGEISSGIARVNGQISETRLKSMEFDQQLRTDAQRELRDIDARMAELEERIVAARDRLSRMDLTAPISGFVNDLAVHTVNGVIAPGATIMSIVPEGEEMVIEAKLSPVDIDQVHPGQNAKLRFSAFNQRTTPEISGVVEIVGAAATVDPVSGHAYYLSSIAIEDSEEALEGKPLLPGMPVEVFLTTTERSAISYLIKPFTDQAMRSFREE